MELSDVGERVFAAEYILNRRVTKGHVEYFIKWKGWGNKHNTWEPECNIIDKRLIKEFLEKERRKAGVVRAQKSTSKAKMIVRSEKRPRGRPPLAPPFKGQLKRGRPALVARPMERGNARLNKVIKGKKKGANVDVKVRGTKGAQGMDRLFVKRPGQGSSETASAVRKESSSDDSRDAALSARIQSLADWERGASCSINSTKRGPIPGLASLTWQPASKRVLDAVCVTDVTAGSGFTVTVRESSVVDGFFRSHEAP